MQPIIERCVLIKDLSGWRVQNDAGLVIGAFNAREKRKYTGKNGFAAYDIEAAGKRRITCCRQV